ncbi:hypothetical protein MMPV_007112 [Pyropia vietnamensis]
MGFLTGASVDTASPPPRLFFPSPCGSTAAFAATPVTPMAAATSAAAAVVATRAVARARGAAAAAIDGGAPLCRAASRLAAARGGWVSVGQRPRWVAHGGRRRLAAAATASRPTAALAGGRAETPDAAARNADPDAVAVIVGASRGVGLAMTQALSGRFKGKIFAACRDPDSAGALQALWQFNPSRLNIVRADVTCEASLAAVAKTIGPRIDLAINTVGVLHDPATAAAAKDRQSTAVAGMPETAIARLDPAWFARSVAVNTLGPLLVAKHLAPALAIYASSSASSRRNGPPERRRSVLATLSARVGSIADNRIGGWYSYRVSKAGQNQATRTLAIELGRRGVIVVGLHPGTVETDLSAPFRRNVPEGKLFAVDDAAVRLLDVIDSLDAEADAGTLLAYDGTTIPF